MQRVPPKLRQNAAADFLGTATSRRTRFNVEGSSCTTDDVLSRSRSEIMMAKRSTSLRGFDAAGMTVALNAVDETIWPLLTGDAHETGHHGHPSSFLAFAFLKLAPLKLPPPPPPKPAKMWVPGKFLSKANGWMAKVMMMAGMALVAGAAIAAVLYFASPAMKMFSFVGNMLVKAGAFMGSAIMSVAQCMADHGLACPIIGFIKLVKGGLKMAAKIGGWGAKMVGKLLGKLLGGAMMLGGLAMKGVGKMFKAAFNGVGSVAKGLGKALGKAFEKLWGGILGMAGFMFKSIGKLFTGGFKLIGKLFSKIGMGALLLGMGFKGVLTGIGKGIAGGAKMLGAGLAAGVGMIGGALKAIPKLSPFKFILGGVSLGLASLGKLGGTLGKLGVSAKGFFIKGIPKLFGMMLKGPHALMIGIGAGLGSFFNTVGHGLPSFMIPGLSGVGELAISMGGLIKDILLDMGDTFIDVMSMGANMAFSILEAGWHFAGQALLFMGPVVVKLFEGALWMAKFLFDQLGKGILAGIMLAGKLLVKGGKGFLKGAKFAGGLALGGLKMVGHAITHLPQTIMKGIKGIGKLFEGAFNMAGSLVKMVGKVGKFTAGLARIGFGFMGKSMMALLSFFPFMMGKLGVGMKAFFSMMGRGLVMGFNMSLKNISKMPNLLKKFGFPGFAIPSKLIAALTGGIKGLGKMGLKGLKSLWKGLKGGAMVMGSVAKGFGKLLTTDPRMLLTGAILLMYAGYMCFGGGMCQRHYQKPGWGMPGTHPISGIRLDEIGKKFKGGKGRQWGMLRSQDATAGRSSAGEWMQFKAPTTKDQDVQEDEIRANGKDYQFAPRIFPGHDPAAIAWDQPVGAMQVVEVDRTPTITSVDLGANDNWNCGPGKPAVKGHPTIILNSPVTSVRVQLYDMQSGEVHWDALYFLAKPGRLDETAREVGSSAGAGGFFGSLVGGGANPTSKHVPKETPPGGWKSFSRLCVDSGDSSVHEYELNITKYPANAEVHGNDAAEEDNHVGTAHFKVSTVQDPMPPSERAAKSDVGPLNAATKPASMGLPGLLLAALPLGTNGPLGGVDGQVLRHPRQPASSACAWRMQRHREFWSEPSKTSRIRGSESARSSRVSKASRPISTRRQADLFFAAPAGGRPSLG